MFCMNFSCSYNQKSIKDFHLFPFYPQICIYHYHWKFAKGEYGTNICLLTRPIIIIMQYKRMQERTRTFEQNMNTDGDNNKSANGRKILKDFWWLAGLSTFQNSMPNVQLKTNNIAG